VALRASISRCTCLISRCFRCKVVCRVSGSIECLADLTIGNVIAARPHQPTVAGFSALFTWEHFPLRWCSETKGAGRALADRRSATAMFSVRVIGINGHIGR